MATRNKWTKSEDEAVLKLMNDESYNKQWDLVSAELKKQGFVKSPKQIKVRWNNNLCPFINRNLWSHHDLELLFDLYQQFGNKWSKISSQFDGRTDNCIKNRFFSCVRRALRYAIKYSGVKIKMSCTRTISKIKPKVLVEFLKKRIVINGNNNGNIEVEIGVIDIIKTHVCERQRDSNIILRKYDKNVVEECVRLLLALNESYLKDNTLEKQKQQKWNIRTNLVEDNSELYRGPHDTINTYNDLKMRDELIYNNNYLQFNTADENEQLEDIKELICRIKNLVNIDELLFKSKRETNNDTLDCLISHFGCLEVISHNLKEVFSTVRGSHSNSNYIVDSLGIPGEVSSYPISHIFKDTSTLLHNQFTISNINRPEIQCFDNQASVEVTNNGNLNFNDCSLINIETNNNQKIRSKLSLFEKQDPTLIYETTIYNPSSITMRRCVNNTNELQNSVKNVSIPKPLLDHKCLQTDKKNYKNGCGELNFDQDVYKRT